MSAARNRPRARDATIIRGRTAISPLFTADVARSACAADAVCTNVRRSESAAGARRDDHPWPNSDIAAFHR
ncbi:hypothetical protein CTI14_69895 [Methylobacterium radiotolerans]|nr:hypothetical protein CTI14_69895 [Methylobacterium radiotolerans]